jgi:hypothetical protein
MKICTACQVEKSVDDFGWRNRVKEIQLARCKNCVANYQRNHYQLNKKAYITKAAKWNKANAEENYVHLIEYFTTHPCIDCNESDIEVLEFDHKKCALKEFTISKRLKTSPWVTLVKEIEKCDVRCANCHRKRTNRQFGSWRTIPPKH